MMLAPLVHGPDTVCSKIRLKCTACVAMFLHHKIKTDHSANLYKIYRVMIVVNYERRRRVVNIPAS
jgi:hypothetical protein